MNPKVIFCIPLFNRGPHIIALLDQLLTLRNIHNDFKVVVSDFGSTDVNMIDVQKKYKEIVTLLVHPQPFIIGKALQLAAEFAVTGVVPSDCTVYTSHKWEHTPNVILLFSDADLVFANDVFTRIFAQTKEHKSYYCPCVSFEKEHGIWTPTVDHHGRGLLGVWASDFMATNGWKNSVYMTKTLWGGHDTHIANVLKKNLKEERSIEWDQYTRLHARDASAGNPGWFTKVPKYVWDRK